MIKNGEFIEYAEVFGNYYGTPKGKTEEFLINGKDIIFDVDWQGGTKIRNSYLSPSVVSIFIFFYNSIYKRSFTCSRRRRNDN